MKNKFRVLGFVTCLLVVWMVTRGSNGCAPLPGPDAEVKLEIEGDAHADADQANADVYGSGKLAVLDDDGNAKGDKAIKFEWHTALYGDTLEGVLTIISTKPNGKDKHMHVPYKVKAGDDPHLLNIKKMKMK